MEFDKRFLGSTPKIGIDEINEILSYKFNHLGGGVVVFPNAIDVDFEKMRDWIDENAILAHEQRWKHAQDSAGNPYATNEDGNKFTKEQIEEVPVRVLNAVDGHTPEHMVDVTALGKTKSTSVLLDIFTSFRWFLERFGGVRVGISSSTTRVTTLESTTTTTQTIAQQKEHGIFHRDRFRCAKSLPALYI